MIISVLCGKVQLHLYSTVVQLLAGVEIPNRCSENYDARTIIEIIGNITAKLTTVYIYIIYIYYIYIYKNLCHISGEYQSSQLLIFKVFWMSE